MAENDTSGKPELSGLETPATARTVEGLRFELERGVDDGEFLVIAHVGDQQVGFLEVQTDWVAAVNAWAPMIENVEVEDGWRRRGIATGMLQFLEREAGVRPHHNWGDISADGEAWATHLTATPSLDR